MNALKAKAQKEKKEQQLDLLSEEQQHDAQMDTDAPPQSKILPARPTGSTPPSVVAAIDKLKRAYVS